MIGLPTGTVTFLFTDIEGSTRLLKELGESYVAVLAEHDRILRKAVAEQGGREIDTQGDSFFFAFDRANAAVGAAVLAQRALSEHAWPEGADLRVRMGLHTGEPILGEQRYVGLGVHRAARIGALAHGGQVLLSNATRELLEEGVAGVSIVDLGAYRLKDFDRDERLYQLNVAGLGSDFPPLKAQQVAEPRAISQAEIEIGSDFVGYRIEELIGQGGMGVVYRAYDLRLKRTVALKLVTPELAFDERFRERFSRETELAMSLEHPNVVPIHDAGEVAGRLYLAMRLVVGTDLRKLLRAEGALEPARALAICRQVASALDAAHARALVHRDVKPSNVLLDENEHVYLADFGLTRRLDEQGAQAGKVRSIGTPAYLAPEQIESKPVDGRADVYSLGCVLYECLTGAPPYPGASRLEVAWAHLEEEPPSASSRDTQLPGAVDAVVETALAKEPEDRYPTCAALIAAAEQALGFLRQTPLHLRKPVLLAAAILVVLGALAAALAVVLAPGGHGKAAAPALFAQGNTLARIDPLKYRVSAIIHVGRTPAVAAVGGHSVWVYNKDDATISEVDATTNRVRKITALSSVAADVGVFSGPVLAADAAGAWFVGVDGSGKALLTRLLSRAGGEREYPLDHNPSGVAVGEGAVWVVGRAAHDYQVLRIDPNTGRVIARTRFPSSLPVDSVAVGFGSVWVVGSLSGTLYRIDPRSARRTGQLDVGNRAARPAVLSGGEVAVAADEGGGMTTFVDPRSLRISFQDSSCCPPDWQENTYLNGSLWWYDWPTGSVYRQRGGSFETPRAVRVVESTPLAGGACLTSIVAGRGAIWVTAAPSSGLTCRR